MSARCGGTHRFHQVTSSMREQNARNRLAQQGNKLAATVNALLDRKEEVVSAILLVLAGILVGWKIVADRGESVREVIPKPPPKFLKVVDFHDAFVKPFLPRSAREESEEAEAPPHRSARRRPEKEGT